MSYSVTMGGILLAVGVLVLAKLGFSESCSSELVNVVLPHIGGAIAWFGRVRAGGVSVSGFKK